MLIFWVNVLVSKTLLKHSSTPKVCNRRCVVFMHETQHVEVIFEVKSFGGGQQNKNNFPYTSSFHSFVLSFDLFCKQGHSFGPVLALPLLI